MRGLAKPGRLEHDDDDETPWMQNAMCGMSEGQARLVSKWNEAVRAPRSESTIEERDQPDQSLSTVMVDGCVNPHIPSRRSPRRRDSSPKSVGSSRSNRDQQQPGCNVTGRTAADAMRALQVMAQKHEEYKGQIAHLKQQLSSVLGKSRTSTWSNVDSDDLAKKNKEAQDMINELKQEVSTAQEKSRKAEEKLTALHQKMIVVTKKHEEYVEQIATLKQQLTSAQSEKDKSKEESLDMVNNFDFIAKKNEKYREQILGLKKQLSQAQDEANAAKEASEIMQKEVDELKAESNLYANLREQTEELNREKQQFKEKESSFRDELTSAKNKSKKDEEKIMKLYGKIQEMKKDQHHEQERVEKQKDTINSLSRQLETIHGQYKFEIDKLRLKEKERVGRYFRTLCFNALLLGFVFVLCVAIPAWMGNTLYGPEQAIYLAAMGGVNIVFASFMSIKFKRQVKFKKQHTTQMMAPSPSHLPMNPTSTTASSSGTQASTSSSGNGSSSSKNNSNNNNINNTSLTTTSNLSNMMQQQLQRRGNELVQQHLMQRRSSSSSNGSNELEKANYVDSNDGMIVAMK